MRPLLLFGIASALVALVGSPGLARQDRTKPEGAMAPAAGAAVALALQLALEHERQVLLGRHDALAGRTRAYVQRHNAYVSALAAYRADLIPYGKNRDDRRAEVAAQLRVEAQCLQREHVAITTERADAALRLARVSADLARVRIAPAAGPKAAEK